MQYEYTVLHRSEAKESEPIMDVLMIGVKKQVVEALADIFLDAELDVESMETETLSLLRLVETVFPQPENIAVLHIGATSAVMAFVAHGQFQFVHVMPVAGSLFTRAIERGLGLDATRAEEYKRTYGLLPDQLEGKVKNALTPILDSLSQDLQKTLRFYTSQNPNAALQKVFLSGGSLYLPNLLPALSPTLNIELVPLELTSFPGVKFATTIPQTSRFSVAVGLALKKKA
jgi:type IV pilus assembly protein PilM